MVGKNGAVGSVAEEDCEVVVVVGKVGVVCVLMCISKKICECCAVKRRCVRSCPKGSGTRCARAGALSRFRAVRCGVLQGATKMACADTG